MRLKRIDPWSAGKLSAAMCALLGLVVGGFTACFALVGTSTSVVSEQGGFSTTDVMPMAGAGVFAILFFPVLYGVVGWIAGVVWAGLYNVVAGWVGGVVLEFGDD